MPKPVGADQRYMPGLDGLRAVAVLAVIAFHEQLGWAPGGLLGVGVFFTLSGYLITDLLLGVWLTTGSLRLPNFWMRRARRLLPALFVMLAVVTAWVTILDRARIGSLRGAVAAAATYSSNWYQIAQGQSYFARFAQPGPLDHLWSLAVEEQFYLFWPWLLLLGLLVVKRRDAAAVRWLALPTVALAAASAVAMLLLYQPGFDPTRVYEGTDTRACGLLVGAALAMAWPSGRAARTVRAGRVMLDGLAFAGLAVIGLEIWRVSQYSPFLYRGGLTVLSLATAAVVAAAACPGSMTERALSWRPLRWLGVRSYGIYLWHYPVIVLTSPANATEDLPRAAAQIAATIVIAALSWRFIEEPVRRGAIGRLLARLRALRRTGLSAPGLTAATCSLAVVSVACAGLAGIYPGSTAATGTAAALADGTALGASTNSVSRAGTAQRQAGSQSQASSHSAQSGRPATPGGYDLGQLTGSVQTWQEAAPLRTSCRSVAHIGDSTSEGMVSADYLPDKADRLPERYEDVGVQTVYTNITGARSVVEVLPGTVNGYNAALGLVRGGFRGCWVIALGTNDTADVAAGSTVGLTTRINRMMSVADGAPVMWVNVISLLSSGYYAESNMLKWNAALVKACARYPNMRIFNWAAQARRQWFISDGIHYTSVGYAARAKAIADALAMAFPEWGHSSGCMVN
jgi:peptidoglycan/LPS O-acetylase OafA/YrhL